MIEERYLIAFFDRQSDYYLEAYRQYQAGNKYSFNIGSFFLGLLWLLYRKLYVEAILIFGALIAFDFLQNFAYKFFEANHAFQIAFSTTANIGLAIGLGFGGTFLYLRNAERKITKILAQTDDEDERMRLLSAQGGISWTAVLVVLSILVGLVVLEKMMVAQA